VEASIDVGAAMLKTGSGFGPAATVAQVTQLRQLARGRAAVKASGGISSLEQAFELVEAGASRLGTSRGVALIQALRQGDQGSSAASGEP
jgi:deoxyribose-phosphate aldolase